MRVSEAVGEFIFPGLLVTFPGALFLLRAAGYTAGVKVPAPVAGVAVVFLLSLSYVVGTLFSELGMFLTRRLSERWVAGAFRQKREALTKYGYFDSRQLNLQNAPNEAFYDEFRFLRAECRLHSDQAAERVRSHEGLLRILRPSLFAGPLACVLLGVFFLLYAPKDSDLIGVGLIIGGAVAMPFLLGAYRARLRTAVFSAIQQLGAQRERDRSDELL